MFSLGRQVGLFIHLPIEGMSGQIANGAGLTVMIAGLASARPSRQVSA